MRSSIAAVAMGMVLLATSGSCEESQEGLTPPPFPRTGQALTTQDFSKIDTDVWKDGLYQVPGGKNVQGIGALLTGCGDEFAQDLELLLDRQYKSFSTSFFQTRGVRQKTSTVQKVVVEVSNNYAPPPKTFSFAYDQPGRIPQSGTLPVSNYSALSFRIYLDANNADDARKCSQSTPVQVVLVNALLDE